MKLCYDLKYILNLGKLKIILVIGQTKYFCRIVICMHANGDKFD